jgi:hypothetical protein
MRLVAYSMRICAAILIGCLGLFACTSKARSVGNINAFFQRIPSTEAYNLEPKQHFSAAS